METYIADIADIEVSCLIQTFLNKTITKLLNDCRVYLTDVFYDKVGQNRAILTTLDFLLDDG